MNLRCFYHGTKFDVATRIENEFLSFLSDNGLTCDYTFYDSYIDIEHEWDLVTALKVRNWFEIQLNNYPSTYMADYFLYAVIEYSAGEDSHKQEVIDILLRDYARIALYLRVFAYTKARTQIQKAVNDSKITQDDYNWLDSIIPVEV